VFWAAVGTLLGAYREGDHIAHETDIDVQVPIVIVTQHSPGTNMRHRTVIIIVLTGFKIRDGVHR